MISIGGFIGWEERIDLPVHSNSLRVNSGRFALEMLLIHLDVKKLLIPRFSCKSILEPIKRKGILFEYYSLDDDFIVKDELELETGEWILLIDFFGLTQAAVVENSLKFNNCIVDLTQSFFTPVDSYSYAFNSARKFFAVPDGAFMSKINTELPKERQLIDNLMHLELKESGRVQEAYEYFLRHERSFEVSGIKQMSALSERLLMAEDFNIVRSRRRENYSSLHALFREVNCLSLDLVDQVPICYPLVCSVDVELAKMELINRGIFVPTYWPEVRTKCAVESFERELVDQTLYLPIDQRYGDKEMQYVAENVKEVLGL